MDALRILGSEGALWSLAVLAIDAAESYEVFRDMGGKV